MRTMETSNIVSGPGADRYVALRGGCRRNGRTYNSAVPKEQREYPLGLSQTVRHADLVEGDFISLEKGKVVPLRKELGFAGIIGGIGQNNQGVYVAAVISRAAVAGTVVGLLPTTQPGSPVYAVPGDATQSFTLEANGLPAGQILAIEDRANHRAIIGIRLQDDDRPFRIL